MPTPQTPTPISQSTRVVKPRAKKHAVDLSRLSHLSLSPEMTPDIAPAAERDSLRATRHHKTLSHAPQPPQFIVLTHPMSPPIYYAQMHVQPATHVTNPFFRIHHQKCLDSPRSVPTSISRRNTGSNNTSIHTSPATSPMAMYHAFPSPIVAHDKSPASVITHETQLERVRCLLSAAELLSEPRHQQSSHPIRVPQLVARLLNVQRKMNSDGAVGAIHHAKRKRSMVDEDDTEDDYDYGIYAPPNSPLM